MVNRNDFFRVFATLQKYFGKVLSDDVLEIYWNHLKDLEENEFKKISIQIMNEFSSTSAKQFPLIADFLALCGKDSKTKAQNIVTVVKKTAEALGQYASVDFGDKALHSVIERYGGWADIVLWNEQDWQFHERNFISAYEAADKSGFQGSDHCPGLCEIENRKNGFIFEEPYKIDSVSGKIIHTPEPMTDLITKNKGFKPTKTPISDNQKRKELPKPKTMKDLLQENKEFFKGDKQ